MPDAVVSMRCVNANTNNVETLRGECCGSAKPSIPHSQKSDLLANFFHSAHSKLGVVDPNLLASSLPGHQPST